MRHYQQALRHRDARGDLYGAGQTRFNIAVLLDDHGRAGDALHYARAALTNFQQVGTGPRQANRADQLIQQWNSPPRLHDERRRGEHLGHQPDALVHSVGPHPPLGRISWENSRPHADRGSTCRAGTRGASSTACPPWGGDQDVGQQLRGGVDTWGCSPPVAGECPTRPGCLPEKVRAVPRVRGAGARPVQRGQRGGGRAQALQPPSQFRDTERATAQAHGDRPAVLWVHEKPQTRTWHARTTATLAR